MLWNLTTIPNWNIGPPELHANKPTAIERNNFIDTIPYYIDNK